MKIFKLVLSVATAGLLAGCAGLPMMGGAPSAPPQALRVNIFPGGFNWPCHRRMNTPQIGRLKFPQFEA